MIFASLPASTPLPCSLAQLARETGLSCVTVRNACEGRGTIASLDRVRHAAGWRWSWTAQTGPLRVGRDMAARRRGKGLSQRDMAARLGVSPQIVLALETRFAGRSETLARYLRILGLHSVLTVPSRRLVPPGNDAAADLVYTPRDLARAILDKLRPHLSGVLLDPARGRCHPGQDVN